MTAFWSYIQSRHWQRTDQSEAVVGNVARVSVIPGIPGRGIPKTVREHQYLIHGSIVPETF
jgi:hypothetical protein